MCEFVEIFNPVGTRDIGGEYFLNLYLLPRYGAVGASIASSISYSAGRAALILIFCRTTGLPHERIALLSAP